jgi:D-arabinose 1-dehydrogenase-like Zn-dependent alcohol dehydrogenase
MEQPTIKVTRVGVSKARQRAKARFGEDSVIRFSLHKRIKRTIDTGGQIYVKISYYAENQKKFKHIVGSGSKISTMGLIRKSSLLRVDQQIQQQQQQLKKAATQQERIDKLVAVTTTTCISELTLIALEKFHMANPQQEDGSYYMALSLNGQGNNYCKLYKRKKKLI